MKHSLALVLSALILGSCASKPDTPATTGAPLTGAERYSLGGDPTPVGVIPAAVLHDARRNKDIEMSIEYPTKGGPYPVIIFSPEYGGSRAGYVGTSAFWTGRGYVVIKPSHADAGATREVIRQREEERRAEMEQERQRGGRRRAAQQTPQEPPVFRAHPAEMYSSQTDADRRNRVSDITFIIDSLPKLIEQYPEITERVDTTKIGVGGHSYGALTALMAASDPRVKAIVAMSPPGSVTADTLANVRVPVLFLTGSRDVGATENENEAWRKQAFTAAPAGDKWYVSIQGAGRTSFTGTSELIGLSTTRPVDYPNYPTNRPPGTGGTYIPPTPTDQGRVAILPGISGTATVRTVTLGFWDAYLKGESSGREFLDKLKSRGDLVVETK